MPPRKRPPQIAEPESVRLQAFLARAGVASRRACEDLIREGRVTINGGTAQIGDKVTPGLDTVRLDRKIVAALPAEWVMLHKPRGYVTTREDESGRKTVYDLLPPELHHLFHVGRLDRDSSGLLILTNDGETANRLLHPRYGTTKEYRADVYGRPERTTLQSLVDGIELEDGVAQVVSIEMKGMIDDDIYRLILVLQEGRNREVRRLLEAIGHPVKRLFRRAFGPLEIGRLGPGEWRHLSPGEIDSLKPKPAREVQREKKPGPPAKRGGGPGRAGKGGAGGSTGAKPRERGGSARGGPPAGRKPDRGGKK